MADFLLNISKKAFTMNLIVDIFTIALPFLYLVTVWAYGVAFFQESSRAKALKTPLLAVTLFVHLAYLVLRTILFQHPPITTIFEIMSIVAFSVAAAYRVIEYQTEIKNTGFFIITLALMFQSVSSIYIQDLYEVPSVLRSNLLGFHVTSAIFGLSAFAISGVYGFLYLLLYSKLKSSQVGVIYTRLPNLEKLERMTLVSVVSGFILLTIAIFVGVVWLSKAFHTASYLDPKLIGTIFVWVLYAAGLLAKGTLRWQGRKMMIISIAGFLFSFFSLTIVNVYFSGFHKFY